MSTKGFIPPHGNYRELLLTICLIHQANYLLDRLKRRLERDFLKEGGLRERMTRARLEARKRKSHWSHATHWPHAHPRH
jgi:four helix bundle suffix protein